ncbi:TadE/TadG family type IV pilus assembly protein, partial [Aeromonas piscicola]
MRRELGVASIELVIILPLLLALLLLVVDVLRVHLQYSTLEHGLRSVLRELQAESAAGGGAGPGGGGPPGGPPGGGGGGA